MSSQIGKSLNFLYFHRRRIVTATVFCGAYGYACYKTTSPSFNEIVRMGVAGSLANLSVEAMFHFADTVNVRAKTSDGNDSSLKIVQKIYRKEGLYGFGRGFSACFYGSVACGFIYFSLYKLFKVYFREWLGEDTNPAAVYFGASFVAEFFTLLVYYPFDLIKCRLQSKNYIFKYRSIPHAFSKEIKEGSIQALYRGSLPFLVTYCLCVSVQFTIYEYMMKFFKTYYSGEGEFQKREFRINMLAAFLGGAIGSGITNAFDVLTINKQTNPELNLV